MSDPKFKMKLSSNSGEIPHGNGDVDHGHDHNFGAVDIKNTSNENGTTHLVIASPVVRIPEKLELTYYQKLSVRIIVDGLIMPSRFSSTYFNFLAMTICCYLMLDMVLGITEPTALYISSTILGLAIWSMYGAIVILGATRRDPALDGLTKKLYGNENQNQLDYTYSYLAGAYLPSLKSGQSDERIIGSTDATKVTKIRRKIATKLFRFLIEQKMHPDYENSNATNETLISIFSAIKSDSKDQGNNPEEACLMIEFEGPADYQLISLVALQANEEIIFELVQDPSQDNLYLLRNKNTPNYTLVVEDPERAMPQYRAITQINSAAKKVEAIEYIVRRLVDIELTHTTNASEYLIDLRSHLSKTKAKAELNNNSSPFYQGKVVRSHVYLTTHKNETTFFSLSGPSSYDQQAFAKSFGLDKLAKKLQLWQPEIRGFLNDFVASIDSLKHLATCEEEIIRRSNINEFYLTNKTVGRDLLYRAGTSNFQMLYLEGCIQNEWQNWYIGGSSFLTGEKYSGWPSKLLSFLICSNYAAAQNFGISRLIFDNISDGNDPLLFALLETLSFIQTSGVFGAFYFFNIDRMHDAIMHMIGRLTTTEKTNPFNTEKFFRDMLDLCQSSTGFCFQTFLGTTQLAVSYGIAKEGDALWWAIGLSSIVLSGIFNTATRSYVLAQSKGLLPWEPQPSRANLPKGVAKAAYIFYAGSAIPPDVLSTGASFEAGVLSAAKQFSFFDQLTGWKGGLFIVGTYFIFVHKSLDGHIKFSVIPSNRKANKKIKEWLGEGNPFEKWCCGMFGNNDKTSPERNILEAVSANDGSMLTADNLHQRNLSDGQSVVSPLQRRPVVDKDKEKAIGKYDSLGSLNSFDLGDGVTTTAGSSSAYTPPPHKGMTTRSSSSVFTTPGSKDSLIAICEKEKWDQGSAHDSDGNITGDEISFGVQNTN